MQDGDTKTTDSRYLAFFRPTTVEQGFERLAVSSAVGGLVGFAISGNITGTAEGVLGGGALYGTGLAGTFAYDQISRPWDQSLSASFFGGEGTPVEIALNPFHGGVAGHAAYYSYQKGIKPAADWIEREFPNRGYDPNNSNWFYDALYKTNEWVKSIFD